MALRLGWSQVCTGENKHDGLVLDEVAGHHLQVPTEGPVAKPWQEEQSPTANRE